MEYDNHRAVNVHKTHGHHQNLGHEHYGHSQMTSDYEKRLWISLGLTIPILLLSPII